MWELLILIACCLVRNFFITIKISANPWFKNKKREKTAEDSFEEYALEDEVYEDTEFSEDDNFEAFTESEDGPDVKSFDKEKNSIKGSKHFRK